MRPERRHRIPTHWPHGFAVVSAVFLLVVLSLLGALVVNLATVQHATSARDVQGSQAYQAARAGVEWGLYQLLQTGTQSAPGCTGSSVLPALGGTLAGFTVTVTCVANGSVSEAGNNTGIYTITSTAKTGTAPGSSDYVERRIEVSAER